MVEMLVVIIVAAGIALLIGAYLSLLASLYPEKIRTNEVYQVRTEDLWTIRVCRYRKSRAPGEPVLLVHGMGANQNNFTSPPNGCLVDYLAEKGYDCWTLDLRGSKSSQPPFERTRNEVKMEDFFTKDIPAVIAFVQQTTHYDKVHWIGHSMGGMLLYAYAQSGSGDLIASGTTLGSPINFNDAANNMPLWVIRLGGKCPALSGSIIRGMIPIVKLLRLPFNIFPVNQRNLPPTLDAGQLMNMIEDPLPALMQQVVHWIKSGEYSLLDGTLDIAAGLSNFPIPLLAFYASKDPFIDADHALEFFNTIRLEDKKAIVCSKANGFVEDYSHCDLAFSKEADREIFEPILKWLTAHPAAMRVVTEEEMEQVSATIISPQKRAHILSGSAYAHLADKETATPTVPNNDEAQAADRSISIADESAEKKKAAPTPAPAKNKTAAKKTPAKKKTASKSAPTKKKTAAPKSTAKKSSVKKKPLSSKKTAAKPVASQAPAKESEEGPSPEERAYAERRRTAINDSFAELMATLDDETSSNTSE